MVNVCKDMEKLEASYIAGGNIEQPLGNGLTVPLKKMLYKELPCSSNFISRHIYKRNENIFPRRNMYTNAHSSIVQNSQRVETTQMCSDR